MKTFLAEDRFDRDKIYQGNCDWHQESVIACLRLPKGQLDSTGDPQQQNPVIDKETKHAIVSATLR